MKTRIIITAVLFSTLSAVALAQPNVTVKHETAPLAARDSFICQYFPALCH